jgi:transcriptional regulator with XRE-family HTH domain
LSPRKLGQMLKALRKKRDMTQAQLAKRKGLAGVYREAEASDAAGQEAQDPTGDQTVGSNSPEAREGAGRASGGVIAQLNSWRHQRQRRAALRELDRTLDALTVEGIVAEMRRYIVSRRARYTTEADLPYPEVVIEMSFLKAIAHCPADEPRRDTLRALYITLDDFFLTPSETTIMNRYHHFLTKTDHRGRSPEEVWTAYRDAGCPEAIPILSSLAEKARRRRATLEQMR